MVAGELRQHRVDGCDDLVSLSGFCAPGRLPALYPGQAEPAGDCEQSSNHRGYQPFPVRHRLELRPPPSNLPEPNPHTLSLPSPLGKGKVYWRVSAAVSTGTTPPPTSMRDGRSAESEYSSSMWTKLWRPILVPCSLTIETCAARGTMPYLTAKAPRGPLAEPVAGSSGI